MSGCRFVWPCLKSHQKCSADFSVDIVSEAFKGKVAYFMSDPCSVHLFLILPPDNHAATSNDLFRTV